MAMSGSIKEMGLVDLIQLACMERYEARLTVTRNDETARIFFSNGEVVHAELGEKVGPDALYDTVAWTNGDFNLDRGIRTDQATIRGAWTAHLLEALVRIDHGKKDGTERELASGVAPPPADWPGPGAGPENPASRQLEAEVPDSSGSDWLQRLRDLGGVGELVLVRTDGLPHANAPENQDEQSAALAAFIGNAAMEIGRTLNLGELDRAQALVGSAPRVVLACDGCFAGIQVKKDHKPHQVALEARRILRERA